MPTSLGGGCDCFFVVIAVFDTVDGRDLLVVVVAVITVAVVALALA
jgi:hypothetical protein